MEKDQIIKLSEKNILFENLSKVKKLLEKNYEISYGDYEKYELKKAIENKSPVVIKNHFLIGFNPDGTFLDKNNQKINIDKMTKAIIVEDEKEEIIEDNRDFFAIINENKWESINEFIEIFGSLRVGEIYLPMHSVVFNFLIPTEKEIKEKIVSLTQGVNVNIYSKDRYVENAMHEIGHVFWRDCLTYDEQKKFERHHKFLKQSAIYEYEWEKSNAEEVFCTIYKWYLKGLLLNKSFFNILEYEDAEGLNLFSSILDRRMKDKMVNDIWEMDKDKLFDYLNPKLDKTTGKKIILKDDFNDIRNLEIPQSVINENIDKYDKMIFINLGKATVPIKNNKIIFKKEESEYIQLQKAKDGKYIRKDKRPLVYVDIDGVVADWDGKYRELFNRNPKKDDHFTGLQFCSTEPHYFRMLDPIDKGIELIKKLKKRYNIAFLTCPMRGMKHCKIDKIEWIREHIGDYPVIFSKNKAEYVQDNQSILIDDRSENLEDWRDAGGTAINSSKKNDVIIALIDSQFNNDSKEMKSLAQQIKDMIVNTQPTNAQKESGIYKKGRINFKGLDIRIENPKGSIRWGFDGSGRKWIVRMKSHYGYIVNGQEGPDGDKIDCFLGPNLNKSLAFVVNQNKEDNYFDEHKIMLGFDSMEEAKTGYLANYQKGWESRIGSIKQTNTKKIREWLESGNVNEPF